MYDVASFFVFLNDFPVSLKLYRYFNNLPCVYACLVFQVVQRVM